MIRSFVQFWISYTRFLTLCVCLFKATETSNNSSDVVSDVMEDIPSKRKEFRKFRSRVYRQNRLNPALERRARQGNRKCTACATLSRD